MIQASRDVQGDGMVKEICNCASSDVLLKTYMHMLLKYQTHFSKITIYIYGQASVVPPGPTRSWYMK